MIDGNLGNCTTVVIAPKAGATGAPTVKRIVNVAVSVAFATRAEYKVATRFKDLPLLTMVREEV